MSNYSEYPVCIDIKRDVDLRDSAGAWRYAPQFEGPEERIVFSKLIFTLKDLDQDRALVVGRGGKRLGLLERDRRVARNEPAKNSSYTS